MEGLEVQVQEQRAFPGKASKGEPMVRSGVSLVAGSFSFL